MSPPYQGPIFWFAHFLKHQIFKRGALHAWLLFLGLAAFLTLIMNVSLGPLPAEVQEGTIASRDFRAEEDYVIIDKKKTEMLRKEAIQGTLPVYDWDEQAQGGRRIIDDKKELDSWREKGIWINRVRRPDAALLKLTNFNLIYDLGSLLRQTPSSEQKVSLSPTLKRNEALTRDRQEKAAARVEPQVIKLKAKQSIIRRGDRYSDWHVTVIEGLRQERSKSYLKFKLLGTFLFVSLILFLFYAFGFLFIKNFKFEKRDLMAVGLFLSLTLIIQRVFFLLNDPIREALPFEVSSNVFFYGVPIAFGAMLVRLVMTIEVALFFSVIMALFAGSVHENNLLYTVFYLLTALTGTGLISHTRTRAHILSVGFWTGVLSSIYVVVLSLVSSASDLQVLTQNELLWGMAAAFASGISSSILIFLFIPIVEGLFGYLTDVQLLELGSLNHPLLQKLAVQAPGTNFHSHMVGTLAEAACDAIGANGLFARVASYFHDVGKMKQADYFIENQESRFNRHDTLTPQMSVAIIAAHVSDGVGLAKEYHLPERVIDIIREHQGTKLVGFFYYKSKGEQIKKFGKSDLDEKDYRYPGPKPQTRESGVILLADTVEAATRATKGLTAEKIEEVVHQMINNNFIDGQLDECDLTLKDLNVIAKTFVHVLMGVYHRRLEYPSDSEVLKGGRENRDQYSKSAPNAQGLKLAGQGNLGATVTRIKS